MTAADHKAVTTALQRKGVEFYTHNRHSGQKVKFILVSPENVRTSMPLPIWVITVEKAKEKAKENIDKLKGIRGIHNFIIKIQDFTSTNKSILCFRCQNVGHKVEFCNMRDRCLKCDGQHNTRTCSKATEAPPLKCKNCGGEHPANYRGCPIAKQYEEKRAATRAPSKPQAPRINSVREFPSLPRRPQSQAPPSTANPAST
jgi:hypothetical protein